MAIPMERDIVNKNTEKFSEGNIELFKKHKLPNMDDDKIELFDKKFTESEIIENAQTWYPGNYRQDIYPDGKNSEGPGSSIFYKKI